MKSTDEIKKKIEICKNTFKKYNTEVEKCCRTCTNLKGMPSREEIRTTTFGIPTCPIRESVIRAEVVGELFGRVPYSEINTIFGLRCNDEIDNFSKQCCDLYAPITTWNEDKKTTCRKLAERIVEQAERTDWCVCCLCDKFNEMVECKYFDSENPDDNINCVEGIRQWLMNAKLKKEKKNECS